MIVSIKLNIAEGSVYTEELSNFLGTQAALMQSGAVINRAHARVTAQNPKLRMQPVALKVTVLPKTTIFVLQGHRRRPGIHAGLLAGLHGGVQRPEEGDADADFRHHGGGLDGGGDAAGEGPAQSRRGAGGIPEHQQRRAVPGPGQQRRQLPGGPQPASGRAEIRIRALAVADGGPEPGSPAGGGRERRSRRERRDEPVHRRPAASERTPITSRRSSNCCSCRPNSRSWAAT